MLLAAGFPKAAVVLFVITFLLAQNVAAQPKFVRSRCDSTFGNYTADSDYKKSLNLLLTDLTNKQSMNGYSIESIHGSTEKVYGLFYCRGDLETSVCSSCVQTVAIKVLADCPTEKDAIIWHEQCTLRYSADNLSRLVEEGGTWVGESSLDNVSDPFFMKLNTAMNPLINKAAYGSPLPGYATGDAVLTELQTLHCLVQCSPYIKDDYCYQCLTDAVKETLRCCGKGIAWIMIFNPSCQLRYDFLPFFSVSTAQPPGSSPTSSPTGFPHVGKNATSYVTRVAVPVVIVLLLVAGLCFWLRRKHLKVKNSASQEEVGSIVQGAVSEEHKIEGQGAEKFSFFAMKKATENFSDANRLGQGGFGAVYKGILQNGEEVAIKRLSKESRQGNKEFGTEVLIVAKLQHRNLVRLLGYCEERAERLLVYEYVPNLSLDHFLFDPSKSRSLDWRTRCNIIFGIARGLRYLHHESRLNIVHRDLKTSNILLDADLNPKIADFGLAKLISLDHTHGDTTKVAGTLGYMAPEYIFQGHFSTKADVYSFGVILLEIVSGQKICKPNQSENYEGLLQRVWRHWEEGNFEELLDPTLRDNSVEVTKLVKIALLCVQQDASTRPSMQMVLAWLNNDSVNIPSPVRPAALAFDTSSPMTIGSSSSNVVEFTDSTTSKYD